MLWQGGLSRGPGYEQLRKGVCDVGLSTFGGGRRGLVGLRRLSAPKGSGKEAEAETHKMKREESLKAENVGEESRQE